MVRRGWISWFLGKLERLAGGRWFASGFGLGIDGPVLDSTGGISVDGFRFRDAYGTWPLGFDSITSVLVRLVAIQSCRVSVVVERSSSWHVVFQTMSNQMLHRVFRGTLKTNIIINEHRQLKSSFMGTHSVGKIHASNINV